MAEDRERDRLYQRQRYADDAAKRERARLHGEERTAARQEAARLEAEGAGAVTSALSAMAPSIAAAGRLSAQDAAAAARAADIAAAAAGDTTSAAADSSASSAATAAAAKIFDEHGAPTTALARHLEAPSRAAVATEPPVYSPPSILHEVAASLEVSLAQSSSVSPAQRQGACCTYLRRVRGSRSLRTSRAPPRTLLTPTAASGAADGHAVHFGMPGAGFTLAILPCYFTSSAEATRSDLEHPPTIVRPDSANLDKKLPNELLLYNRAAVSGGGLYAAPSTAIFAPPSASVIQVQLQACSLAGNVAADNGGGLYAELAFLGVADSSFASNVALNSGGGLFALYCFVDMGRGNSFTANSAVALHGGGMAVQAALGYGLRTTWLPPAPAAQAAAAAAAAGSPGGNGTLFARNSAGQYGGGVYIAASNAALSYLVLLGNSAGIAGGGLFLDAVAAKSATLLGP